MDKPKITIKDLEPIFDRPEFQRSVADYEQICNWLFGNINSSEYKYLLAFVIRKLGPDAGVEDAEDLLQDFASNRLYSVIREYNPAKTKKHGFWNYLLIRLGQDCLNRRRSITHHRDHETQGIEESQIIEFILQQTKISDTDPANQLIYEEFTQALKECAKKLSSRYSAVFELRFKRELSIEETARMLNISEGLVKVRWHRTWQILVECLKKKGW